MRSVDVTGRTMNHASTRTLPPPRMRWRWLRCNVHHLSLAYVLVAASGIAWFGWSPWMFGIPAVLLIALVTDGIARPGSGLFYPTLRHGARDSRWVALTFDDGPDPVVTPQVLDVLAEAGARATFFVIGEKLAAQPELARRMVSEGHVLGNHSWRHSRWQNFRFPAWHAGEIRRGEQAIAAAGGTVPALYRPPVGLKSGELARAVHRLGLTLVAWSLHSRDTRLPDPEAIATRVLKQVRGGDIVLLHDGHDLPGRSRPHCAAALRLILRGLREKGLDCVTVPELLAPAPTNGAQRAD
ncbi:MAG TPA: polysaccharide deacetylase family protein [Gammaproteobacteria bacterium]|nr:polysaccharide deacetylase family protein [Gammaproteobacteria bacterium]